MKNFLLTLLLALVSATTFAALPLTGGAGGGPDSIAISGNVLDAFTREYLDSVSVEMYELPSMRLVQKTRINDWLKRYDDPDERKRMEQYNPPVRRRVYRLQGVPGTYLLCFSCKGYQDKEEQITIPPKRYGRRTETWEVKDVLLDRDRSHHLDEAVVTATKVKMFTKGDTVVYNADAFQVADGSMLDGLIAMMPGLEIRDGGRIYHNGEYVPELLLNGKDFFSGDPAIALKNLPAYTVKDLRIYHKAPDGAYLRKDLTAIDTLSWNKVIDVRLKKQYSHGWIANAEVAAGYGPTPNPSPKGRGEVTSPIKGLSENAESTPLHSREGQGVGLCRLFGLHFSDHTRLGIFANINNINDTGLANNQGDWKSSWTPEPGVTTMQLGALDFTVDGKKTKINYNTNVQAVREVSDTQSETSSTTFLPSGDVFNRSRYSTNYDRFHFVWANNIKWSGKKAFFNIRPGLDYFRKTYDTESLSAQFGPTPNPSLKVRGEVTTPNNSFSEVGITTPLDSLYVPLYLVYTPLPRREGLGVGLQGVGSLVNSVNSTLHRTTDTWRQSANLTTYFTEPLFGNYVQIAASQLYSHDTPHETQRYALTQAIGSTLEDRYTLTPSDYFSLWGYLQYSIHKIGIFKSYFDYSYSKTHTKNSRERYLQDLSATDSEQADAPKASLPSNLQTFDLDLNNSYHSKQNNDSHDFKYHASFDITKDLSLSITPELQYSRRYYADTRGEREEVTRRNLFFTPSAGLSYSYRPLGADSISKKTAYFVLNYEHDMNAPDITYFLNIRDTSDPLRITLGNPNLRNSYYHKLSFYHNAKRKHSVITTNISYTRSQRQVAQGMSYNAETGVYTYRPDNVDGNWNLNGRFGCNLSTAKLPLSIYASTGAGYNNSVDLIGPTPSPSPKGRGEVTTPIKDLSEEAVSTPLPRREGPGGGSVLSEVHNTNVNQRLGLAYSYKKMTLKLDGDVQWNYATSERQNFKTRSTFDCYYGANLTANDFLWGFSFSTDLALRQRRGYDDASMNDTNLVWDAQLSRSFGKTKAWNVRLKGHDLLHQLSNVTRVLNAQGLTETWTNSLPSFLMLHVSYRWNKQPKKK